MRSSQLARISIVLAAVLALLVCGVVLHGQTPAPSQRPTFQERIETVYVNVVVRDRNGRVVRDLTKDDFVLTEDDKPQTVTTFDFEQVPSSPSELQVPAEPAEPVRAILKSVPAIRAAGATAPPAPAVINLRDRRLVVLLFDVSSMQPEDLEQAVASAREYVQKRITPADLVAIASVGSMLTVDQDFTSDRAALLRALDRYSAAQTAGYEEGAVPDPDETPDPSAGFVPDETEFNIFNTDRRLQAIETLADALAPIEQKKSILYFSSGMSRTGQDNQVQLRAAIDRAVKSNVSIYPVDTRGLTAIVPGGEAQQASAGGTGMFSGRSLAQQFDRQAASQETLVTLASDTGGRAFLDTNDFGEAFARVIEDTSAYYLLGYTSTNTARDGRFRRIKVKVTRPGVKIEHRAGYYAGKDFAHASTEDREQQLQDQLLADISATDLTVWLSAAYFRMAGDRFYVPVSVAVPGSQIPFARASDADRATLDVIGLVRDAQHRAVGRLRDTVKLAVQASQEVQRKSVQYDTSFVLPPGKYTLKVVLRENQTGAIGSFETDLNVPDLRQSPVKVSSVLLGTQVQPATVLDAGNPLVQDGIRLVPSLTHVVSTGQSIYFYYEVYDPSAGESGQPHVLTSLSFFRGRVRTYETPLVEATRLTAPDRRAAIFQFAVPASVLKPGLYTCQITVVDDVAGAFAFPRLPLLVRQ